MSFKPKFTTVQTAAEVADRINLPHEDYPARVPKTLELVETLIDNKAVKVDLFLIRQIHSSVMEDLQSRGSYRTMPVTVSGNPTGNPLHIAEMMDAIGNVCVTDDLVQWYTTFQTIHPFEDGNGRTGGIVVAVLSYLRDGVFMAPCQ